MAELVCVLCPTGCRLTVACEEDGTRRIVGASCARGREYAASELVEPLRVFTGTVRVSGGASPLVAVKTDRPIPRERLLDVARASARMVVPAPVEAGAVILEDLPGDARLIATASAPPKAPG